MRAPFMPLPSRHLAAWNAAGQCIAAAESGAKPSAGRSSKDARRCLTNTTRKINQFNRLMCSLSSREPVWVFPPVVLDKLPNPIQIPDFSRPPRDLNELVQQCRWLRWYYVFGKDGKPTKKPAGKWGNPIYWLSYSQAIARIPPHGGIGFILSHNCDIGVVDLDDC